MTASSSNPVSVFNLETEALRLSQASIPALPTTPDVTLTGELADLGDYTNAFQRAVYLDCVDSMRTVDEVQESARARMLARVRAQYGDVCPTFDQYKADRAAFQLMANYRGLASDQVIRKPYCLAINELFGALPVSDSPAAIAKRAQRPVKAPKVAKTDTPPTERVETVPATIGQFIAKYGAAAVLVELAKILATEKATSTDAKTLIAVASHLKAA